MANSYRTKAGNLAKFGARRQVSSPNPIHPKHEVSIAHKKNDGPEQTEEDGIVLMAEKDYLVRLLAP